MMEIKHRLKKYLLWVLVFLGLLYVGSSSSWLARNIASELSGDSSIISLSEPRQVTEVEKHSSAHAKPLTSYYLVVDQIQPWLDAYRQTEPDVELVIAFNQLLETLENTLTLLQEDAHSETAVDSFLRHRTDFQVLYFQINALLSKDRNHDETPSLVSIWKEQSDFHSHFEANWLTLDEHLEGIEQSLLVTRNGEESEVGESEDTPLNQLIFDALRFLDESQEDSLSLEDRPIPPRETPLVQSEQAISLQHPTVVNEITPAYQLQADPVPEDLLATPEIHLTPEMAELAQSLNNSPVEIFQFVRNNIEYEMYRDSLKGATATLWSQSGNDFDQAALLLSLLRSANIPSRYVIGQIAIPIEDAQNWLGVTNPYVVNNFLNADDIFNVLLFDGFDPIAVQINTHIWVEAYVPQSAVGRPGADSLWVPLDPSFKQHQYQAGATVPERPFERDEFLTSVEPMLPNEAYIDEMIAYLHSNMAGTMLSELPYQGEIIPEHFDQLPLSLPYVVDLVSGEYSELPDSHRHKIRLWVEDSEGETAVETTQILAEINTQRLTISYLPEGAQVRPEIKLDGQVVASGELLELNEFVIIHPNYLDPLTGEITTVEHGRLTGDHHTIALNNRQYSDRMISERAQMLLNANANVGTPEEDIDDLIGELLHIAGLRYYQQIFENAKTIASLNHYQIFEQRSESVMSSGVNVIYLFDRPFSVQSSNMSIDGGGQGHLWYEIDGSDNATLRAKLADINAMTGSSLEHQIWEELINEEAVSAVKAIQAANAQGIPIHQIDSSSLDTILPLLNLSASVESAIESDVNNGWVVTVHQDEVTINDWQGAGWITENAANNTIWYVISGYLNGGATTCSSGCASSETAGTTGEGQDSESYVGCPVTLSNGNMFHQFEDIVIPTRGQDFSLTRTYNSQSTTIGPFGYGWTHSYNLQLIEDAGTGDVTYLCPTGGQHLFISNGDGTFNPPYGFFLTLIKEGDGTYSLKDKFGTMRQFDENGRLTSITDRHSNTMSLSYDSNDRLSQITDPLARSLLFNYNNDDTISSIEDFTGRIWTYDYDANDNLIASTTPDDSETAAYTTTYTYYDEDIWANNLKTITNPEGEQILFTYYISDQIFQTVEPEGKITTFRYLPLRKETHVINERGFRWVYRYNDQGHITRIMRPDRNIILREWDGVGNLVAITDAMGYVTSFTHDALGNILTETDPLGHTTTYSYDPNFSQLSSILNKRGHSTTFNIDPTNGNRLSETDQQNFITNFTYDAFGNLESITDANTHTTTFFYDGNDNLSGIEDGRGNFWPLTYDALGRLLSTSNPLGDTTTYTYDALGRMLTLTDGENNTQLFTYDGNNNLMSWTDSNQLDTIYTYDGLNNVTTVTDANGNITQFTYQFHNLVALTDANGNTRRYEYDVLNRLESEMDAQGLSHQWLYDGRGNATQFQDEYGHVTLYIYDPLSQLLNAQFPDGDSETFSYDEGGNLLTAVNAHTTISFVYDERNQITQSTDSALNHAIEYTYDNGGNRATMTDPDSVVSSYGYDGNNNLTTLTDFNGTTTIFNYDVADRVSLVAPQGGHPGVRATYGYDAASRLTILKNSSSDESVDFIDFDYTYDNEGNLISVTAIGIPDFGQLLGETGYTYDNINQLTGVTYPNASQESYDYDNSGNRSMISLPEADPLTSYYDEADHLTYGGVGEATYTYDRRGNLTTKSEAGELTVYHWDHENQLIQIDFHDGSFVSYAYDALGRRINKSFSDGTEIDYFYDGLNIIQEFDQSGQTLAKYTHTLTLDHPISMTRAGETYFYLYDQLGSVIGLSDGASTLEASYIYDPWGNVIDGDDGNILNPVRFTGRDYDSESGLYYYRARYYSPKTGRFISKDPIGIKGGINLYQYVKNSPNNYIDPLGLFLSNSTTSSTSAFGGANQFSNAGASPPTGNSLSLGEIVIKAISSVLGIPDPTEKDPRKNNPSPPPKPDEQDKLPPELPFEESPFTCRA